MAELLISLLGNWQDNIPSGKKWLDSLIFPLFNRGCLKNIPRWACIAFGARCARRVENLIISGEPDSDASRHRKKISAVIGLAEKAASIGRFVGDRESFTAPESAGIAASLYLPQMGSVFNDASRTAGTVIFSAGLADPTTPHKADDNGPAERRAIRIRYRSEILFRKSIAEAADLAIAAVTEAFGLFEGLALVYAMNRDLTIILKEVGRLKLSNNSSVKVDIFGPLWPNGQPFDHAKAKLGEDITKREAEKEEPGLKDQKIWRYMKIERFEEMLKTRSRILPERINSRIHLMDKCQKGRTSRGVTMSSSS